ncbi:permease prefix domain 1-containing protein [Schumannella luteola]
MSSTLTDRYVSALTRLLPSRQRKDIAQELRASIADAMDERLEAGMSERDAERETLAELGDPVLLAARYTDRPTALIGPRYYGDYRRLLGLLTTIGPGTAIVVTVAQVLYAVPLGLALLAGIGAGLAATAVSAVALTALFAIVERLPRRAETWAPVNLPEGDDSVGSALGGIAFLLGVGALLVLSPWFSSVVDADGQGIPVLSPALWPAWAPLIVGVLVVAIVFAVVTEYRGWSIPLAVANAIVVLGGFGLFVWAATHDLFLNADFFEAIGWGTAAAGAITVVVIALLGLNAVVETVGGFVKARRRAVAS